MPRKVRINGNYLGMYITFAVFLGLMLLILLLVIAASSLRTSTLARRGVPITAAVTSFHLTDPKTQNYRVAYSFEPPELAGGIVKSESGEFILLRPNLQQLKVGHRFSVTYDPRKPDRSMPTADLELAEKTSDWLLVWIACMGLGSPPLVGGVLMIIHYRRQKRILQWGNYAPAHIVDERQYSTRGGPISKVTYAFEDDKGRSVLGKSGALPAAEDPRFGTREERDRYLANPVAVYDPRSSKRNVLYPGTIARLD